MTVGSIVARINRSEQHCVVILARSKPVLTAGIGQFLSIPLSDHEKLSKISEETVSGITTINNMIALEI